MQLTSIIDFIPSALGLFVAAVLFSFTFLLFTVRIRRILFGEKKSVEDARGVRGFMSNFD